MNDGDDVCAFSGIYIVVLYIVSCVDVDFNYK
jgi:hypothetical protein